ncbi:hypothetical protein TcG_09412 [Trypanosoma cruzi]|nr:hypothetical protein TcG_09412 [Trypanosoma cruzi]
MHQRGASSPQTVRTAPTPHGPPARTHHPPPPYLRLIAATSDTRTSQYQRETQTAEAATTAKLPPCCADATARKGAPATGVHRAGDRNEPNETPKSHTLAVLSGLPQRNHNK